MTKVLCPQFPMPIPQGIENESTRTLAHAYSAFGLSRDGALPKALHIGKPDDATAQHFVLFPGGKQMDLSFAAMLLNKDRAVLQCFESAIGFDRKHYEDKKDAIDQKTPLARFYQDQVLEVWDPILATKTQASETGQPVIYKDLLKFWEDGIGDANTSTLNLAVLQAMLDHVEHKDTYLTIQDLVAQHDKTVAMTLEKGGVVCHAVDWGKKFYMNDQKEYQVVCEKPANLAELVIAADKDLPSGSWKLTPPNFSDGAQQMKVLGLKPANLKEAGQAFEVMPDSPQAVLNVMGYDKYKAIPKTGLIAVVGAALAVGFGLGWLVRNIKASRKIHQNTERAIQKDAIADDGMPRKPEKTKAASETAAPAKTTGSAPETRVVSDPFAGAKTPAPATRTVVAAEGDMADLAAALSSAGKDKSPLPGASPSNPPATTGITADNVIIRGTDARPSAELNKNVVMAEIAYLNPKFLTEDGTAIHSNFKAGVEQLADLAMQAFGNQGANAASPTELWRVEHGKHGSMIRGGLPEGWLREFVGSQLEKWHAAGAPGMSFDVTARETMERDATRRAGERSAYEKWVEDALRDPVRLAGR